VGTQGNEEIFDENVSPSKYLASYVLGARIVDQNSVDGDTAKVTDAKDFIVQVLGSADQNPLVPNSAVGSILSETSSEVGPFSLSRLNVSLSAPAEIPQGYVLCVRPESNTATNTTLTSVQQIKDLLAASAPPSCSLISSAQVNLPLLAKVRIAALYRYPAKYTIWTHFGTLTTVDESKNINVSFATIRASGDHIAFLSSRTYSGKIGAGGLAEADRECQAMADSKGYAGMTWKAILSASSSPASEGGPAIVGDARERLEFSGPIYNAGSLIVSASGKLFADVGSSMARPLSSAISFNESQASVANAVVRTGSDIYGQAIPDKSCSDWSDDNGTASANGASSSTNGEWVKKDEGSCAASARIYCVSQ